MSDNIEVLKVEYDAAEAVRNAEALKVELAEVTTYALAQATAFKSTGDAIEVFGETYDVLPSRGEAFRESQRAATRAAEEAAAQLKRESTETERLATAWKAATGVLPQATTEFRQLAEMVDVTTTASQRATTASGQLVIVADQAAIGGAGLGRALGNAGAGRAILELSRGIEDLQYGLGGVLNNIPGLLVSLGGGAGLAGVVSLVAVGAYQLYRHWDDITALWSEGHTETEAERMERLEASTHRTAEETAELNKHKERQAELERILATQSKTTEEQAKATQEAIKQVGGPKFLADLEAAILKYYESINKTAGIGPLRDFQRVQAEQQARELTTRASKGDVAAIEQANEFLRLGGFRRDVAAPTIGQVAPGVPGDVDRDRRKREEEDRKKAVEEAKRAAAQAEKDQEEYLEADQRESDRRLARRQAAQQAADTAAGGRRRQNRQEATRQDEPLVSGLYAGAGLPIEALLQRNAIGRAQGERGAVTDAQAAEVLTQRLARFLQQTGTDRDPLHAQAVAGEVVERALTQLAQRQGQALGQTQNLQAAMIQVQAQFVQDLAQIDARTYQLFQQLQQGVIRPRQQVHRNAQNRARN